VTRARRAPAAAPLRERYALVFAFTILGVWVVVATVSLVLGDYTELGIVTPALMLAAGYMFGVKWLPTGKDDDGTRKN
jgi:hypothetical protein